MIRRAKRVERGLVRKMARERVDFVLMPQATLHSPRLQWSLFAEFAEERANHVLKYELF